MRTILLFPLACAACVGAAPPAGTPTAPNRIVQRYDADTVVGSKFAVPDAWDEIVIGPGATVRGSFLIPDTRAKPLLIRGADRETSRLVGMGDLDRNTATDPNVRDRSGVMSFSKARVTVSTLTSLDPDKFHILARGPLTVEHVTMRETRGEATTDGVGGGDGTIVRDVLIDSFDDALKVYSGGMLFEDVTIVHNRNGAPIQFGWGAEKGDATIRNLTVIANSPARYNQGVFARAGQREGTGRLATDITIEGFRLVVPDGMARPPLFTFGRRNGRVSDAKVTVTGLCSGNPKPFATRAEIDAKTTRLNDSLAELLTPDCR
ncbi:Dextranase precursor [Tsuneonella dongtanensis]|uniref:Dextranase n=1 Tax=Tsuneonella dongtanensis TaxID=692370 RepID=A0A1B2ABC2_9SPHN|nr:hypothetical protein [Tsuneonella dongtanensis]ANY19345.1 Dextranase precursor [Tsuneonella dongtanensis]